MISEERFLEEPLINLASSWELYIITKTIVITVTIVVFGIVYIGLEPVTLT